MKLVSASGVSASGDGHYVVRGPVTSRKLGAGTATYTSTVAGGAVRGTVVATFKGGTIKTTMRGHFTLAPSGDVLGQTTGTGRITGGTGDYAHVRGTFRFTGTSHADGSTAMVLKGEVRPPKR